MDEKTTKCPLCGRNPIMRNGSCPLCDGHGVITSSLAAAYLLFVAGRPYDNYIPFCNAVARMVREDLGE